MFLSDISTKRDWEIEICALELLYILLHNNETLRDERKLSAKTHDNRY